MAARASKAVPAQTWRIANGADLDAFATFLAVEPNGKGTLSFVAIMRAAAKKGVAFTIDGYAPAESTPVGPTEYKITYSTPAGQAECTLTTEYIRETSGISGSRGRIPLAAFGKAVAESQNVNPRWLELDHVYGNVEGAIDLMNPPKRTRKSADGTDVEDTDSAQDETAVEDGE